MTPVVGQVWKPRRGGMWRTIVGIHPAGVEWTETPDVQSFVQFETWDEWVRDTEASPDGAPEGS
jgi:hypothetical protein